MKLLRRLHLKTLNGIRNVDVELALPVERDNIWACHCEIGWPEGRVTEDVLGSDSLQAIYLAMQAIALRLYASPHHKAGNLYWSKPGEGYGFPMPKAGLADLVGDDKASQS